MEPVSLTQQMADILTAHHIPFDKEGEWLIPYGELPAVRASWFAGENSGRLDIEVLLQDNRVIYECFAGLGKQQEGIQDALQNFNLNSFPALLAAFWKINDPEQVSTKEWLISGKEYIAYVGNIGSRDSAEANAIIPEDFIDTIENTIKNETTLLGTHWFRCFFCNVAGEHTFEVLANNQPWPSGLEALQKLEWEKSPGFFSVRHFLVLREKV